LARDDEAVESRPRELGRRHLDPRILKAYGPGRAYDALGLPIPSEPQTTPAELLVDTVGKETATIGYMLARTLKLKPGQVSRQVLQHAIVEHFLSFGDPNAPLTAFLSGGDPRSREQGSRKRLKLLKAEA
jgi:hypothetical protein